ncbi:MAG TPA: ATP-binding protein, partial [Burkholderiaceae bacterium]|nr:ATP-binding protein [Burkholderiaceae bacterium]
QALAEGVVFQDANDRVLDCNDAACRILGLSRAQLLGVDSMDPRWHAMAADGRPFDFNQHPSVLAQRTGQPVREVLMGVDRPDGRRVWISINSQPLIAAGAQTPHATVTSFVDVTARVEAEQALQQLNQELESRVAQRTAELKKALQAAEQANRAKSEFLSRMSHELRTPLNAILGFAQVLRLRLQAAPAGVDQQLAHIESAGWHLLELINDVLDLSRIEAGSMVVSRDAVPVAPLLASCVQLVHGVAQSARVEVQVTPVDAELAVLADTTRLRQVLVNLMSNACKYNRPGGTVNVEVLRSGNDVLLRVADTGAGMTPAQMAGLFQPFNRLGAEQGPVEGTGIGLVIARRLVELMQGSLAVESVPGSGSTFTVRLPAATLSDARPRVDAPVIQPVPADRAGHYRVLYVEDNPANVQLLVEVMRLRPAVRLEAVGDAETALARVQDDPPDMVIVDIALPGMDGYTLCSRLRRMPALARTPMAGLSANAMEHDRELGMQAGFDRYFTKPLDVAAFLRWLDEVMAAAPSR